MANKYMKRCTALATKEVKTKTRMKYCHILTRMMKIKKTENMPRFGEDVEYPVLSHIAGGNTVV